MVIDPFGSTPTRVLLPKNKHIASLLIAFLCYKTAIAGAGVILKTV